jgi:hypothetical protein
MFSMPRRSPGRRCRSRSEVLRMMFVLERRAVSAGNLSLKVELGAPTATRYSVWSPSPGFHR